MATITITEALADIKTTQARIEKKRGAVKQYLARDSRMMDPMEAEGGSKIFVQRERQSIRDLEAKIVKTRTAIQSKNLITFIQIEGQERSVSDWLNWRREVSEGASRFLQELTNQLMTTRARALQQGMNMREQDDGKPSKQGDLIVSLSEADLAREVDEMQNVLGQLDGKLSLVNATTFVEV